MQCMLERAELMALGLGRDIVMSWPISGPFKRGGTSFNSQSFPFPTACNIEKLGIDRIMRLLKHPCMTWPHQQCRKALIL